MFLKVQKLLLVARSSVPGGPVTSTKEGSWWCGCRILKLGPLRIEHDLREPTSVAKTASSARGCCVENE